MKDGTITKTDHRRGIWTTINPLGIMRERNLRTQLITDHVEHLSSQQKIDPETGALITIREDNFLKIDYVDGSYLIIFEDESRIHVEKKPSENEDTRVVNTYFEKEGYAPVKILFDPVKARA